MGGPGGDGGDGGDDGDEDGGSNIVNWESGLPPGVLDGFVFPFLIFYEVVRCSTICKSWNEASEEEDLWRLYCMRLWRGKSRMPMSYVGAPEEPFEAIRLSNKTNNKLGVKVLKTLLRRREVNCACFLEKSEFRKAFVGSTPGSVGPRRWDVRYDSLWKASYIYSIMDSRRQIISKAELCGLEWVMFLKQGGLKLEDFHFLENGKLKVSYGLGEGALNENSRWRFAGFSPKRLVQVDQFPPLMPSRLSDDWGWVLHNQHVVFYSVHYSCVDRMKLFTKHRATDFNQCSTC